MGLFFKALGGLVLYYITKAVYNLYFHPLSKYPGPKPWIVSRIPYLVCMNSGRLPFKIKELHDEYGPVVRLGVDELSINDARAWKDIFNRKDMLRPPQWGARPPGVEAYNVISASAPDHARFRKALNPAFSEKATREYEPLVRSYMNKLITRVDEAITKSGSSAVVDIVDWINFTTFDIIGELAWSKGYDCLETGAGHAFMGVLLHFQAALIGATIKYYPWLDVLLAKITPKSAFQLLENIFHDGHQRLEARMKVDRTSHPDILSYIKEHNDKVDAGNKLSDAEIEQNVLAIIVGGSETLTTTFSGVFHYLLADPTKLGKLVNEVRAFPSATDITASAAAKLPYLNAVIDETLRICPPLPDALRRVVPSSDNNANIAGRVIPPGTTVSVSCYSMFKSADHFENPEVFEPERWMQGKEYPAYYPFALGSHNCPGQPLARLEMRLLLTLFLYRYDVKVPKDEPLKKWTDQKIYWTWEKQPLKLEISLAKA
ncbi:isotrichodermin C-15 hydroxylase [Melanomma pulvis-pyrius CBS 109.77]|uniref:Isotrichodermin C-15 hydroxylase n=1 Tax=Melanomma pulvis-pyrius CBS 109.77 TaxID=1314802 RepID=A0A6A6XAI9_9PLEO|nr:isotrichodermin C-15 hydroxylase [Melanomma pulvis-pyrius CBS 109.77]